MNPPESLELAKVDEGDLRLALLAIEPMLVGHGGGLEITGIEGGVVSVSFLGACESCPAIAVTYAGLVRTYLLQVQGVSEVRTDQVHASAKALDRIARALGAPPVLRVRANDGPEDRFSH